MDINDQTWCSRNTVFLKTWKNGDLTASLSDLIRGLQNASVGQFKTGHISLSSISMIIHDFPSVSFANLTPFASHPINLSVVLSTHKLVTRPTELAHSWQRMSFGISCGFEKSPRDWQLPISQRGQKCFDIDPEEGGSAPHPFDMWPLWKVA